MKRFDVVVVGAGILGLAHGWACAKRGKRVLILERTPVAEGATIRNFGMLWPIGQPVGELHETAMLSHDLWLELDRQGAAQVHQCGSIHVAHHADEMSVLEEFAAMGTHHVRLLSASEVLQQSPIVQPRGLRGGLKSETEMRVDPRTAAAKLASWLAKQPNVTIEFGTTVVRAEDHSVTAADGRTWKAEDIIICSGSDLKTLRPEVFSASPLKLCKLQMLQTRPSSVAGPDSPHIASGLTLRHYTAFRSCPSLARLTHRIASESPELDNFGIHVMASTFADRIVLGDSHEYDDAISPFDNPHIESLMVRELQKILQLDDWTVTGRWHGIYAKHPTQPLLEDSLEDGVHVFVGTGGAGMTMSMGLAERSWQRRED